MAFSPLSTADDLRLVRLVPADILTVPNECKQTVARATSTVLLQVNVSLIPNHTVTSLTKHDQVEEVD